MSAVTHEKFWLLACALLLPWLLSACGGDASRTEPPAAVSALIGPAGGTLTGPDGVQVVIPAGALRTDTTIGIARDASAAPPRDADWPTPAAIYEFTPHGVVFEAPVTLRFPVPAGTTDPTVFMAGMDSDWGELEATLDGGFASVQRNTFSWGMVITACSIPANAPPNPDRCFSPRGHTAVVASPSSALTLISPSNAYINGAGTFRLDAAATLNFTAVYNLWPTCSNARLTFHRRQLDKSPQLLETLFDQTVGLQHGFFPDGRRGSGGTTVYPAVALSHLDQGRHVYSTYIACQRADGHVTQYTDTIVINVEVPIPATTQTIGGHVAGLTGTVVLRNNGADDLTLNADGAFTFPTPVATGAPYHVTVGTQPGGQTCTVQNGTGAASADVGNVLVTCSAGSVQAWQGAALIESGSGIAYNPDVAVDSQGNAIAVWMQYDGMRYDIWASRYSAGGGWGTPQLIETGDGNAQYPAIAMDAAGNATAIWTQHDGSTMSLRSASYSGGTWSADVAVESGSGIASSPHLDIDASGNVLAVWEQQDGGQTRIKANRRVAGVWQGETNVDGGVGPAQTPQVKVFPNGSAIAVWIQEQSGTYHLFHNAFNGTGWSTADRLVENTSWVIGAPQIAGNGSGGAIVVWDQGTTGAGTSSSDVLAVRYSGGLWTSPVTLSDINAQHSYDPRIAMNATGQAMVIWRESHGDARETWARHQAPDGNWDANAVRLDAALVDGSSGSGPLDVGIDANGNAVAIWAYAAPGAMYNDLYATRHDAGAMGWDAPQLIENVSGGGINTASLAVDGNGNAIAVWDQDNGSTPHGDILANLFR